MLVFVPEVTVANKESDIGKCAYRDHGTHSCKQPKRE